MAAIRRVSDKPIRRVILTHYHADHFYGLRCLWPPAPRCGAHRAGREYFTSGEAAARLCPAPERPLPVGGRAHPPRRGRPLAGRRHPLRGRRPAFPGQLPRPGPFVRRPAGERRGRRRGVLRRHPFAGRIPFVGSADSRRWLVAIDVLAGLPKILVTGHGAHSTDAGADLWADPRHLLYLREQMGQAVDEMTPFEGSLRPHRLAPLQQDPGLRGGQPHQRLRHLPDAGARVPRPLRCTTMPARLSAPDCRR